MAKFFGEIGFATRETVRPGVYQDVITTRKYSGDVLQNNIYSQAGPEKVNDDMRMTNRLSIVADPFAYENFHKMRYISWLGAKWKVTHVETKRPRLILTLGGVYNDQGVSADV